MSGKMAACEAECAQVIEEKLALASQLDKMAAQLASGRLTAVDDETRVYYSGSEVAQEIERQLRKQD
eukprot:SAG31_NODE_3188_length_4574_cov_2.395978_7_plen_67_part_00